MVSDRDQACAIKLGEHSVAVFDSKGRPVASQKGEGVLRFQAEAAERYALRAAATQGR